MLSYLTKQIIKLKPTTTRQVFELKREAVLKFKNNDFPKNSSILKYYRENYKKRTDSLDKYFEKLLRAAPIRSLSGIVSVTVLTKPYECPGKCIFCPKEIGMPKSYLKNEPAAARALTLKFDPYLQVKRRIESLEAQGHNADKIELIILGGTWSYYTKNYQNYFIKRCFEGANGTNEKFKVKNEKLKLKIQNLKTVQKINETAKHRIVGLTIETRPDYINEKEIMRLRRLGVTRVELGVESVYDDVLKYNKRGHGIEEIIDATKLLKDSGFKVNYHIMLDLPGSSTKKDEQMFKILFFNERFQPDWLKIYPTSVLKTAPLYKLWKAGKYKPYTSKKLIDLIIRIKKIIPPYVRITRVIRDIPLQDIVAGSEVSNLRQDIAREMKRQSISCQCIRCREIREEIYDKNIELVRREYDASSGKEIFLSFEDKKRKHLYALLRLRIPSQFLQSKKHFIEELTGATIIRELHTHGNVVALNNKTKQASQHKGLGKKLMIEAERISKEEFGAKKIAVISGIGVREYYKKLGYKLEGTYMTKNLKLKV
ncbi:MAG: tRNA uridine(34) 5-carboxymethylaminomethyl modification radical SAM/GNAT enzyme Elp3 [Candidatus Paceibacterota bacterium]